MKKSLAILLLATPCFAGFNTYTIQNGQSTNKTIYWETNKAVALNAIGINGSLDIGTGTNTAVVVKNPIPIGVSTLGIGIGGSTFILPTTNIVTYTFQKSWDGTNWLAWTNYDVFPTGTTNVYTNFNPIIGDYFYARCSQITNTSSTSSWISNRLYYYWKSVP